MLFSPSLSLLLVLEGVPLGFSFSELNGDRVKVPLMTKGHSVSILNTFFHLPEDSITLFLNPFIKQYTNCLGELLSILATVILGCNLTVMGPH